MRSKNKTNPGNSNRQLPASPLRYGDLSEAADGNCKLVCSHQLIQQLSNACQLPVLQWSAIFPPEQVTELQSTLFVKKLLAVAVSTHTLLTAWYYTSTVRHSTLLSLSLLL